MATKVGQDMAQAMKRSLLDIRHDWSVLFLVGIRYDVRFPQYAIALSSALHHIQLTQLGTLCFFELSYTPSRVSTVTSTASSGCSASRSPSVLTTRPDTVLLRMVKRLANCGRGGLPGLEEAEGRRAKSKEMGSSGLFADLEEDIDFLGSPSFDVEMDGIRLCSICGDDRMDESDVRLDNVSESLKG
jgi:hypothetical protein